MKAWKLFDKALLSTLESEFVRYCQLGIYYFNNFITEIYQNVKNLYGGKP